MTLLSNRVFQADISCEGHFGKGPVRNALLDVMRIPYDRRGYNESDLGVINCSSRTNPETIYDWFAVDNVNYKTYFAGRCDRDDREDCFRDYMRLVRHRTESAFEAPLRQMQGIPCVMRQTTGNLIFECRCGSQRTIARQHHIPIRLSPLIFITRSLFRRQRMDHNDHTTSAVQQRLVRFHGLL